MKEIQNVTVEDIKALAPVVREMLENGGLTVVTSANDLAGREGLFDVIEKMP